MQTFDFSTVYQLSTSFDFSKEVVASGDFIFNGLPYSLSTEFKFSEVAQIDVECSLDAMLSVPTLSALCEVYVGRNGTLSATLDTPLMGSLATYILPARLAEVRITRCAPIENAVRLQDSTCFVYEDGVSIGHAAQSQQESGFTLGSILCAPIEELIFTPEPSVCSTQQSALPISVETCYLYEQATPLVRPGICSLQSDTSIIPAVEWCMPREQGIVTNADTLHVPIEDMAVQVIEHLRQVRLAHESPNEYSPNTSCDFDTDYQVTNLFDFTFGLSGNVRFSTGRGLIRHGDCFIVKQAIETNNSVCSLYEDAEALPFGQTVLPDDPRPPVDPEPPSGNTYIVPTQEIYPMLNTITTTMADLTPIDLGSVNLGFDVDSHSWTFSAQLLEPSQQSLVTQNTDGTPKIIHVTINGYVWYLLVERITVKKRFGDTSISLSGRGVSALLGAPYQPLFSLTQSTLFTNQQLAESLLPNGWTLVWELPTWNIPAGAFSIQNTTPIAALSTLVKDCGGMLVPSRDSQTLTAKPRYPVLPWNFNSVNADIIIPDDVIIELNEEPTSRYDVNGVYVHGMDIGGELALVRLNGTAGDRLAPTTSNQLMTDVVGLRSLGERLLAGAQEQPTINSVTSFMDGTIMPIVDMGLLVQFDIGAESIKGIINGISIRVSDKEVIQSFTIGEATKNTFTLFKEILPADPLLVGTVSSTDGNTSLMGLIDGGAVRVRGVGVVGQKYYIRSGELSTAAPNLTGSVIIV